MDPASLQLRLVVRPPAGEERDVEVRAPADAPADAVAQELAAELGLNGARLPCARTGRVLAGDEPHRPAQAYESLAAAARGNARGDFDEAAASVGRGEEALDASLNGLGRLGYRVSR